MTTISSLGNTGALADEKIKNRYKGRNFMMTVWPCQYEILDKFVPYAEKLGAFQYILICSHDKEDTGEMNEHKHVYLQLDQCRVLSKKMVGTIHIDECLGSAKQCYNYLMGLDDKHKKLGVNCVKLYENGRMLNKGLQVKTVEDAKNLSIDELVKLDARSFNTVIKIKNFYSHRPVKFTETYKPDIEVIYLCGSSDKGKTKWVYDYMKAKGDDEPVSDTIHFDGKYWDNINPDVDFAIYDEWRDWHMEPTEFLKLIDFYCKDMRVLYGYTKNNYKHILITTTQDLNEIYTRKHEDPKQWYKRITRYINLDTGEDMTGREKYDIDFKDYLD